MSGLEFERKNNTLITMALTWPLFKQIFFVKQTSSIVVPSPPKAPLGAGITSGGVLWPITLDPYKINLSQDLKG
jgi:hypothetical protein